MRTSCLQLERIKRIEVDQDPGKKGCFCTVKIELEELEIQKNRRVLGKNPSTFLWFHHIYAYFISILRGVFTLDGCHWAVANHWNQETDANSHTYTFLRLRRYRTTGDLQLSDVFAWHNKAEMKASSKGIPILRGGLDFGCMPFSILCITIKIIQLGLLLSTWETSHGWWFTSKYWKTLRFKLQRYRCPERRKMGFSLASGVLQRSDLHWPWSAPKKRLMGMVHKESPERTAMCLWHIETLHQLTAPMEMSVVCN